CEVLPNYNAGKKAAELGLWREAYVYFDEVCRIDAGFKDAVPMRNECLAKGAFTVAYIITDNKQAGNNMEEALAATIKGELLKSENPFLELLERENLAVVIKEQQQTLSPEFDNENSNLGKLKKAQFILSGELVHFKSEVTPVEKRKCDCATTLGIADEKVICYEVTQNRMLNASFKYQLIDAETGKLYLSDVISFADQDYSKKHEYEIQKKLSLLSPTFTKDHDVNLNGMKQTTPDVLLTEQDLLLRMYASFANKVSSALSHFSP
ncbi:MAG: CsgG/HfaB family protein, partial [Flavobacteriales bacterium]